MGSAARAAGLDNKDRVYEVLLNDLLDYLQARFKTGLRSDVSRRGDRPASQRPSLGGALQKSVMARLERDRDVPREPAAPDRPG